MTDAPTTPQAVPVAGVGPLTRTSWVEWSVPPTPTQLGGQRTQLQTDGSRDITKLNYPAGADVVRFFDRVEMTVTFADGRTTVLANAFDNLQSFYPGGRLLTPAEAAADAPYIKGFAERHPSALYVVTQGRRVDVAGPQDQVVDSGPARHL